MAQVIVDTTVRGGFPVTVTGRVHPPSPSTGEFTRSAEITKIETRRGKPIQWLKLTEADLDQIREDLINAC